MSKKGGLSKRLKSFKFFRSGSSSRSSRSAALDTAQSKHSISTRASEATEPLETGEARPSDSEHPNLLVPLVQLLGKNGKSRTTSCSSSMNGIEVIGKIQLPVF